MHGFTSFLFEVAIPEKQGICTFPLRFACTRACKGDPSAAADRPYVFCVRCIAVVNVPQAYILIACSKKGGALIVSL